MTKTKTKTKAKRDTDKNTAAVKAQKNTTLFFAKEKKKHNDYAIE